MKEFIPVRKCFTWWRFRIQADF